MGQGSVAGHCETAVPIAHSIYRSVCERELDRVCERRCWGTVIWASFCVSNLLTQFLGSGVRSRVSIFSLFLYCAFGVPVYSPGSCLPPWTTVSKQYLVLPPLTLLFLFYSTFVWLSYCHVSVSIHHQPRPLSLIWSPSDVFKKTFADGAFEELCFKGSVKGWS